MQLAPAPHLASAVRPKVERSEASPRPLGQEPGGNVRATFVADAQGGGQLDLEYSGPIVAYDPIWVRLGERRHGKDWLQTRDVLMHKAGDRATLQITLPPGERLEGVTFAFFTTLGRPGQELWDNAGKPFGCYLLDAKTGEIQRR